MQLTARTGASSSAPEPDPAQWFRAIFDQAAVGVAQFETGTGRFLQINQRYCDIVGYPREELLQLNCQRLTHPDDQAADLQNTRRLLAGELREFTREKRYYHKAGHVIWVNLTVSPLWQPGERPTHHIALVADITHKKQEAEALRESEERYQLIAKCVPDLVWIMDLAGRYSFVNTAVERTHGYTVDEWLKLTSREVVTAAQAARDAVIMEAELARATATPSERNRVITFESEERRKDGSIFWAEVSAAFLWSDDGTPIGVIGITRDITERKRTEAALRQSESLFRGLFENHAAIKLLVDPETGAIKDANAAAANFYGWPRGQLRTMNIQDLNTAPAAVVCERMTQALARQRNHFEFQHRRADGTLRQVEVFSSQIQVHGQTLLHSIIQDISERKRAEQALRESELLLQEAQRIAGLGTYVLDFQTGHWQSSAVLDQIFGIDAAYEHSISGWARLVHAADQPMMAHHFQNEVSENRRPFDKEYRIIRQSDRAERWVHGLGRLEADAAGRLLKMVGTIQDITERKRAEAEREKLQEQLLQAQKMESVGRLAGGVAHDFNNMLQTIIGHAALSLEEIPAGSPLRESLEEILKSAERSADLTRQLLAFARKQPIQPRMVDLNDKVAGTLKMLRRLIGENIELIWVPGADLWPIKVDPSQIDQILANLCVNSRDAISGTGTIHIKTANTTLAAAQVQGHSGCAPGEHVMLTVSDTGAGMDAEVLAHLFEPFFTTKEVGKGTGLGLATVFGIVTQNQGLIQVESEPGKGTTFRIYLPRAEAEAQGPAAASPRQRLRGTETILLVEDEVQVLNLGRRILTQQGYTVLAAATPEAALQLLAKHAGPIHLLVTDVVMPGMNGKELRERLHASHPDLKCLFISGYTAEVIAHHGVLEEGIHFLQKPFGIDSLAAQVRAVLDQAQA